MSGDQLQFIDYRKPKLETGEYVFSTVHRFTGTSPRESRNSETAKLNVRVEGERVSIDRRQIISRYPPVGESGSYTDTLSHITFNKGTLPWTRFAFKDGDETIRSGVDTYEPWLYLLVVNENDFADGRVKDFAPYRLQDLRTNAYFPEAQFKSLLNDPALIGAEQRVDTVVLEKRFVKQLLLNGKNTSDDRGQLEYLAHIRRRWKESDKLKSVYMDVKFKSTLNNHSLSIDQVKSKLSLPDTATNLSVIREDKSWLVQDSVKGDLLLEVVSDDNKHMEIQIMELARESSVLVANRFAQSATNPNGSGRNIAMVLSLEKYFTDSSFEQIKKLKDDDGMRFLVLTSWEFECQAETINFEQRSKALNANALKYASHDIEQLDIFGSKLEAGMVPLPHILRNNDRGISWYRGPLTPHVAHQWQKVQLTDAELGKLGDTFLATDADKLLRYHPEDGMLDISYAAAYELGRMLSLQKLEYLEVIRQYKTQCARHAKLLADDEHRLANPYHLSMQNGELPYSQIDQTTLEQKRTEIEQWLLQLGNLSLIPPWYLVPDEKLLPKKSVRTFNLDPVWIQSLWLGALSIDGRPALTVELLNQSWQKLQPRLPRAGALLYSDLLEAYPELVVQFKNLDQAEIDLPDGTEVNLKSLALQHFSSVSDNIDLDEVKRDFEDKFTDLIELHPSINIQHEHTLTKGVCLYLVEQPFDYLSLALPPESLHYGADVDVSKQTFHKDIKFRGRSISTIDIPMSNASLAIINVLELVEAMRMGLKDYLNTSLAEENDTDMKAGLQQYLDSLKQFKSARVGRFMLEGEPKVEFTVGEKQ